MAKRKSRKQKKQQPSYSIELKGIALILIMVIGCCPFGVTADIIKGFAGFIAGGWYILPLIGVGAAGIYMMVKREKPDFLTSRLVGLYVLILGILILSHTEYIKQLGNESISAWNIITATIDNLMAFVNHTADIQGGGMLGAIFSVIGVKLLTLEGTEVVCIALIICGIIMFTGVSIYDAVIYIRGKLKNAKEAKINKKAEKAAHQAEEEYENEDKKVVISSIDELPKEPVKEETLERKEEVHVDSKGYNKPPMGLLIKPKIKKEAIKANQDSIKTNVTELEKVIKDFGVEGKVVAANIGPSVTQYELEIKSGTRLSKITTLNKEIALELGARDVRIQAPIPGKKTVGIELPNKSIMSVSIREILEAVPKTKEDSKLLVALGKSIMGNPVWCEIDKTPHLLVAGSTGSGKSVCINSMITSILMRTKPDEVKLVLVDPKKVELSMYNGVPHLLTPVVTDPKKANIVLQKIVKIMEDRYDLFEGSKTKNIAGYNAYVDKKNESLSDGEKINYEAKQSGDEPYWLAQHCKGAAVLTCSNRTKAAQYAKKELHCTKLILDDGFQHQKLARDLNILVVDSEKQFSNGFVLPLGALREPLSEIKRADRIIVVNKNFNDKRAKTYARYLRKKYNIPTFVCSMLPDKVYDIKNHSNIEDNQPVIAFSAIGQPEQFYKYLRNYDVMATKDFPDHHIYTKEDIENLRQLMKKYDAKYMITTEKDAVKLKELADKENEIFSLRLKPVLDLKGILDE